ncbi:MAG TPA: L-serine ammonia-lyase [Anaeromyxobacter sp.]|nr:L-serine ammonia-lyase [Anaeromyxobacter sp.]
MATSVFELFKIGIGPSSSHTVGPMKAARRFAEALADGGVLDRTAAIAVDLHGSLGATGRGHGTDRAVLLGLLGETPEGVDVDAIPRRVEEVRARGRLAILGRREIAFREAEHLRFLPQPLPFHPNGMRFAALDPEGRTLLARTSYSVGGGFVVDEDEAGGPATGNDRHLELPLPFASAAELLRRCAERRTTPAGVMLENERALRPEAEVRAGLLRIWATMEACVERGCRTEGTLPGGLEVPRRAPGLLRSLSSRASAPADPLAAIDWVNLWALAVTEENAGGGRVVTAPTNGAAGIVPAVLHYYRRLVPGADDDGVVRFLLTAGAVGALYKENASISGAEVGCQGEVGSACSMAAAGLAEVLGGSPAQIENAAEIAMEHNLGLTCDPVGGLVQIPCIERNAMAAMKALNAARMALRGDGHHLVSLDEVIRTMRETGADMQAKYKETALGGLAVHAVDAPVRIGVNLPEC